MAGGIGEFLGLAEQRLPFGSGQSAALVVRTSPFTAMVEKPDVVVGLLQRLNFARDKSVKLVEIGGKVGRQRKIQVGLPRKDWLWFSFGLI